MGEKGNFAGGAIPRWATTILLAILVWMGKRYVDGLDNVLAMHEHRIATIELWKASKEGKSP